MRRPAILLVAAVAATLVAVAVYVARPTPPPSTPAVSLRRLLSADDAEGYATVADPAALTFPADHGPHAPHRIEWWYFTGNLVAGSGRRFGFQLTFFRRAVAPRALPSASAWSTNQVYMAHFAVTDVAAGTHVGFEKFGRGAAGLAGARGEPFRVWIDDWSVESDGADIFPMRLRARDGRVGIDLHADASKPVVRHGRDGLSEKTRDGFAASYYYSYTRVAAAGRLSVGGSDYEVAGTIWMDHEWSSSVLDGDHVGWDWFSVQLDDGADLMCFRMRHADGPSESFVTGTYVSPDGRARTLRGGAVELVSHSGAAYPSSWRLTVPEEALVLDLAPLVSDQEMTLSVRYWEGAVRARGRCRGEPVAGYGYAELTGYEAATATP